MGDRFDVIVIGSGFGGATVAGRLAEAGARVLVLERGRRWTKGQYPRSLGDPWVYQHTRPHRRNGWLDLRFFRRMIVVQGAGVGGGSLCYSSVVMEADPDLFDEGWPPEITYDELRPYYDKIGAMLGVRSIPGHQQGARYRLLEEGARRLSHADRFESVPLAISFDEAWSYDLEDPLAPHHSKQFVNDQGVAQGTCVHLGNCDIGCDVQAKNTLDLNYVPLAERHGAEVRPLHLVRRIEPDGTGYRVAFDRVAGGRLVRGEASADRVVVAAGSLGSTELLLRCRDQYRTLPRLSPVLGKGWSPNANALTPDRYRDGDRVKQGIGPTISAGLDFMDGSQSGQRFYIEDDGFPNMIHHALAATGALAPLRWLLRLHLRRGLDERNPTRGVMVWLGEGIDAADGELRMRRRRLAPWRKDVDLRWDVAASRPVMDEIIATHRRLSEALGGKIYVPLYWRILGGMVTVHPLGGCAMGAAPADGVVDHSGAVFGYPNLYVVDGSIVPTAIGRNPSMTIGALGERAAALMSAG